MSEQDLQAELKCSQARVRELTQKLEETEKQMAELRESRAQLNATLESLPFQFFALDTHGRYVLQNSVLREAWGDLTDKRPEDIDVDEATLRLWQENNRRAMSGETVSGEVSWKHGDQEVVFHNVVAPVRLDGNVIGVLGVNIDITQLKRTEAALRESELKFRAIVENVPGLVFAYDQDEDGHRELLFAGPGVEYLIGEELAKQVGNDLEALFDLIHPDDREMVATAGENSPDPGAPVDLEYRYRDSAGNYRWARSISRAIQLTPKKRRWHGVLIEVTDKVLAKESLSLAKSQLEERVRERTAELEAVNELLRQEVESHRQTTGALQQSEYAIRAMMNATSESIILVDLEATILAINEAGARRFGSTEEEMIGKDCRQLMSSRAARSRWFAGQEVLRKSEPVHVIDEREGRTYDSWYYPVFEADGKIRGLAIFARDITEQQRSQRELERVNTELDAERRLLETKNIALNEIIRSVEEEKNAIKRQVQANVSRSILPLLSQLAMRIPEELTELLNVLRRSLEEISGAFTATMESRFPHLTPREIDVCKMIRGGMHSKEIAGLLNVSVHTVEKFRQSIRRKLKLLGKKQNLQTYLQSL
ncbi:MAG: PAS domain S-box protein [bacterium]